MNRIAQFLIICLLLLSACHPKEEDQTSSQEPESFLHAIPAKFEERKFTYLERELEYLMQIWPGEYDNVEQLDFDKMADVNKSEEIQHQRVHSFARQVKLREFGDYAIYFEEYQEDDPQNISRQGIYKLSPDESGAGILMEVYHLVDSKPYLSIKEEPVFLKNISPDSPKLKKGCDMILKREGMGFLGKTLDKSCIANPKNEKQSIDYQIRITENEYEFEEILYEKSSGRMLSDKEQIGPYLLEKARCFVCMIDFPREKNGRPVKTEHYIKIHDQGGKFEFDYSDGRHMVLGMRNTWSFGMQRETFVIFIQEGSQKGPTLIYSWGAVGADRIGFNPGWIRVQCDLDTPRNIKLQQELRPDS